MTLRRAARAVHQAPQASCLSGETVIGGGCKGSSIFESVELADGWRCGGTGITESYVLCLRLP